jgi:hypothetical protein
MCHLANLFSTPPQPTAHTPSAAGHLAAYYLPVELPTASLPPLIAPSPHTHTSARARPRAAYPPCPAGYPTADRRSLARAQGMTPLHMAASNNQPKAVKVLIVKGADVKALSMVRPTAPSPLYHRPNVEPPRSLAALSRAPSQSVHLAHLPPLGPRQYR